MPPTQNTPEPPPASNRRWKVRYLVTTLAIVAALIENGIFAHSYTSVPDFALCLPVALLGLWAIRNLGERPEPEANDVT
jgi:hypothetical protein